jgi:hypothetical protein
MNYHCLLPSRLYQFCGPSCRHFRNTLLLSWNIFCDLFQQSCIWNTAALKNRRCSTMYLSRCMLLHQWTEMHLPATNRWFIARLLSPTANVTLAFENSARELTWLAIWRGLRSRHSCDLTPRNVCLSLRLKDKSYLKKKKSKSTLLARTKKHLPWDANTFRTRTPVPLVYWPHTQSLGNIFSIYCSRGEFYETF